ncbi:MULTISPECIES: XtrA/YqaO family protein [Brevibacillus]|uniref:XtrA/YqaO family protein n=1 Tax=Brevibacillus laterosporus TaxID=1465 RepID=A0AAP3G9F7_BRELA|nr:MULTISPECIES: XtrA/YqaO family protein [Brevibacillus]AYB36945.1 hypothetical protein D5F52_00890 [Brevibacillus laterosporus]MBG9772714.1 hypothetical protein [Brevibacillus laterosporus]MBG9798233.1 hypothetical protein [Brevibacillus laterosporus]MBM7107351.1 hypothetical protein [Brevibacillus laterosporus]MCG7318359.1 XtrA/YqaO family protein [Brevibacillus laterosporus]
MRSTEMKLTLDMKQVTIPVGEEASMVLIDPVQGKIKIVPLVHHGETVVKSSQGKIAKIAFQENELF